MTDYDDDYEPDGSGFEKAKADVERLQAEISTIAAQANPSGALVPVSGSGLDAVSMKQSLAETRALVMRKQSELEEASKRMRAELDAQMSAARAALAPIEKFVARLTEAIETVNLYLGRDEEIVTLRDGEPAPEGTPIVCRSMVLAMDEECAIDPEGGGIDARNIEAFDEWLMESDAHLNQVLPEVRGVVVIVPSKQVRDYGDPWTNRRMSAANLHSYWLIRNGERVFRMDTSFEVGYRLVPARDEFTGLFYRDEYEWGTGKRKRVPMEPGSSEWQRAEEAQGARERHYMKVALILQGLIDRTTVFHPLPAPNVSLLRQDSYDAGHVVLIDEEDRALTTGRQPFQDWLREHNAELRPGMRIVGAFDTDGFRAERYDTSYRYGNRRLSPANADSPDSYVLHYIDERRSDGGLVFRYDRGEIWDEERGKMRPAKVRASCTIYASDEFIIPIDLVTEAEMLDYLNARTERHAYLSMFPLLKAAIQVKREEREAERPFMELLTGRLVTAYDLDAADASEVVHDLVQWWKFTNKYHRPLVGKGEHEAKALRMIEEEYASRRRAAATDDPEFVARLKALPGVMLVGRQRDGSYIALAPEPRLLDKSQFADNVYAHEWVGRPRGKMTERDWVLVSGTRAARWRILWHDERWNRWNRVATAAEHLSDPEAFDLAAQAVKAIEGALGPRLDRLGKQIHPARPGTVVRVTYAQRHKRFTVWVWPDNPLDYHDSWGHDRDVPDVETWHGEVWWKRGTAGAATLVVSDDPYLREHNWSKSYSRYDDDKTTWTAPWDNERGEAIVWRDDSKDEAMAAACATASAASEAERRKITRRSQLAHTVIEEWSQREEQAAYARFIDDYADPELWEGHRKTLRLGMTHAQRQAIEEMVDALLDDDVEIVGRTVGELLPVYIEISTRDLDDEDRLVRAVERKRANFDDEMLAECTFREPEPEEEDADDDDEAPEEG